MKINGRKLERLPTRNLELSKFDAGFGTTEMSRPVLNWLPDHSRGQQTPRLRLSPVMNVFWIRREQRHRTIKASTWTVFELWISWRCSTWWCSKWRDQFNGKCHVQTRRTFAATGYFLYVFHFVELFRDELIAYWISGRAQKNDFAFPGRLRWNETVFTLWQWFSSSKSHSLFYNYLQICRFFERFY